MDIFTAKKRSDVMRRIRGVDTRPELAVRQALHRAGYRFVLHDSRLPGRPDIVLPRYRMAVQVRGCFWHAHSCRQGRMPKSRRGYWVPKLLANKSRDRKNDRKLKALGWHTFVAWECKLRTANLLSGQMAVLTRALRAVLKPAR